ncbi:myosin tail region-interacting protein MTI1 [Naviculisporaceae sp. PSN 640]
MSLKVKAIYEYSSPHEDDLNFAVGQIITVTDEEDAEWYGGEYVDDAGNKHEGIFPRNFVEKYEPTAPPRPTRTRTKKEPEHEAEAAVNAPASPTLPTPVAQPDPKPEPASVPAPPPTETVSSPPPLPASNPEPISPKPVQASQVNAAPPAPRAVEAPAPAPAAAPKPAATQSKPSGPPPVAEKPSSFKDRIAAFNKAAAPPVAPFKPGGLGSGSTGFIKKPFVAPPPSRNAYIPPPQQAPVAKIYRREEDPEIKEQEAEVLENAGKAGLIPAPQAQAKEAEEDLPKPMSLKERLALLQKQQQETAARHADALAKKDKPKRPPKKRTDTQESSRESEAPPAPAAERADVEEVGKSSVDETHPPRVPHQSRRKSSRGAEPNDGNEADMSGAGDTTEGQEELTEKEEGDERNKHVATAAKQEDEDLNGEEDDEEDEEEDIDPEVRRREELRARMARMAGGMGMPGMPGIPLFGAPPPIVPKKKKAAPEKTSEEYEDLPSPRAPPVPTMMALPGMSRPQPDPQPQSQAEQEDESEEEEDESRLRTPHQETAPGLPSREPASPPPIPGGRPAPPPVPSESRPPPIPASSAIRSPSEGSESDDELSERPQEESDTPKHELTTATRAPPPPPVAVPPASQAPPLPPVTSPRPTDIRRDSYIDEASPVSPTSPQNKRASRLPPPIPGAAPAPPAPAQTRPPPPPPPGAAPPISRSNTADAHRPTTASRDQLDGEGEITEYEGDYDTDIASSVPHKDALKAHQRESSFDDVNSPRSPTMPAPPPPPSMAPRAPPPIPAQSPPSTRKSTDMPRMAPPPPPPPAKDADEDDYDPYNYGSTAPPMPSYSLPTPPPHMRHSEDVYSPDISQFSPPQNPRAPPPAPPPSLPGRSAPSRPSLDVQRGGPVRRSVDVTRPSMESGFVANDIDLANNSGWWLQPNSLPPQLQGRKDIYFEAEESVADDIVTRDIYILYQDYSQTVITVRFNPQNILDVDLEQRHEAPPRALRQDQLEQSYERFGRAIGEAVHKLKDTVVGDGTPQALVYELLKPYKDALHPVGTRAYGALVYSNLANASTSQNDEIRPGDIISIRNARFQGKHGAMHAKYSAEVGKPDHVAVVAEWDGTKKKVRAWEQGRESKKVKMESFKLDDLRSGEVKIWRVMPRSWIGWESSGN